MTGARVAAAAVVGLVAALAVSCTPAEPQDTEPIVQPGSPHIDVADADLVRIKARAGMLDCPATFEPDPEGFVPMPPTPLPSVVLPCLGGGRDVDLGQLRGPAVVNLWASNCAPCRDELPILQQVHEAGDGELLVLGIDYRDAFPQAALELLVDAGVTFPSVADVDGQTGTDLRVVALPQTVFINAAGSVVATERAEITSYEQAADLVEQHLGVELAPLDELQD